MKKRIFYPAICAIMLCMFLSNCKKSGSAGTSIKISGVVLDELGSPISGAKVTCGTISAVSGSDGKFYLTTNVNNSTYVLQAAESGHFTAYKNVPNVDGSGMYTKIYMMDKSVIGTMSASGGTVSGSGFSVTSSGTAFKNADGTAYSGMVSVSCRYVRANDANILNLMPGGDLLARDATGKAGILRTFGFVQAQFTDASGNLLIPDQNNVKCFISVPTSAGDPIASGAMKWDFDTVTGYWGNPTSPTASGANIGLRTTATGDFYPSTTTISRNLDGIAYTIGYIKGQVVCDGKPRANASVYCTNNSFNRYSTYTNDNGYYLIAVEASTNYTGAYAYQVSVGSKSVTVPVAPTAGNTVTAPVLTSCDSNSQIAGTAGNPRFNLQFTNAANVDLDLHVIAPDGTEIYYGNTAGAGGTLDVDCACDQCPNGPNENIYWEVGSAPRGTYKYFVVYYGDCSSASGASSSYTVRVMNVNSVVETKTGTLSSGQTTVFTYTY